MARLDFTKTTSLIALMREADPHGEMFVRVLPDHRLALGRDPLQPTNVIDLSTESVRPYSGITPAATLAHDSAMPDPDSGSQRRNRYSGLQWFELNGDRTECGSVKELLMSALKAIEAHRDGTLEKLSHIRKRTKRIVARDRNDLFTKPKLVRLYSQQLLNGWWVGTNNSSYEVETWLRQAVSLAGLEWGKNFRTSL